MSAEKDLYMSPFVPSSQAGFRFGSIGPSVGTSVHHHHAPSYSVYSPIEGSAFNLWTVVVKKQNKKMSIAQKFWSARAVPVKRRSRLCLFLCGFFIDLIVKLNVLTFFICVLLL